MKDEILCIFTEILHSLSLAKLPECRTKALGMAPAVFLHDRHVPIVPTEAIGDAFKEGSDKSRPESSRGYDRSRRAHRTECRESAHCGDDPSAAGGPSSALWTGSYPPDSP